MQLDVFSDTICPWCYVGKRRLERALKARPQQGLTIRWRAFQLNPGMPADGMDRRAYVEAKFGSPERAQAIYETVRSAGQSEGIAFAFERIRRTPNTLQSHRLIRFAAARQRQNETLAEQNRQLLHRMDQLNAERSTLYRKLTATGITTLALIAGYFVAIRLWRYSVWRKQRKIEHEVTLS